MTGYIPKQRTKVVEAALEAEDGSEPFRATIVTSLTFGEIDEIPFSGPWVGIFDAIAPYVVAWNAMGRNSDTGEYEPLPPPAEAGPDVLRLVPTEIASFLVVRLKTVHLGDQDDRLKESGLSNDTPDGKPATDSESKRATHRKSQKDST